MLFLFNSTVLDLGSPVELLKAPEAPMPFMTAHAMPIEKVVALIKEAVFASPDFEVHAPEKARHLAALVACKSAATGMLAMSPRGATAARQVVVRMADVSLVLLTDFLMRQKAGSLTAPQVNQAVWAQVA